MVVRLLTQLRCEVLDDLHVVVPVAHMTQVRPVPILHWTLLDS